MALVELEIAMDKELIGKTHNLALRYFGDDSDTSLARLIEVAFKMRCFWSRYLKEGEQETDEAVSNWVFAESPNSRDNIYDIRCWLFRR